MTSVLRTAIECVTVDLAEEPCNSPRRSCSRQHASSLIHPSPPVKTMVLPSSQWVAIASRRFPSHSLVFPHRSPPSHEQFAWLFWEEGFFIIMGRGAFRLLRSLWRLWNFPRTFACWVDLLLLFYSLRIWCYVIIISYKFNPRKQKGLVIMSILKMCISDWPL